MLYEITATKKRPQTLNELFGQEFVVSTLKNSIEQGRIAHAYIFSGPRGVGKTSAARILAKALNCEKGPTPQPCGKCNNCQEITRGNALDVIEIDGASNTSVNDVREIKDEVLFAPNICKYKVYIIDEVHMLSNSAFNALLKTIEEPPPYIVFIFATTEIHKVPATIRSRCQQFNFKLISITQIKERLKAVADENNITIEDSALFWIAKESTGSMRDAYTLFDQIVSFSDKNITLDKIKEKLGIVGIDELNIFNELMADGNSKSVLEYIETILSKGIAVEQFIIELTEYFRNILFLKHEIKKDYILGYPVDSFSQKVIKAYTASQLEYAIELLLELYKSLKFSLNQRFELELVISKLSYLKDIITQKEILAKITDLKKSLSKPNSSQNSSVILNTQIEKKPIAEISMDNNNPPIENSEKVQSDDHHLPDNLLQEIVQLLHKNKKLTLASSLEKIESWELIDNELNLNFNLKDKFSGELIKKEKKIILDTISSITTQPLIIKINFIEIAESENNKNDDRIEILKDIFNGEIIKGE